MTRYPRAARNAALKCIPCSAPLVRTNDDRYVCVECGNVPIKARSPSRTVLHVEKSVAEDGGDVRLEYVIDPRTDEATYFRAIDSLPQGVDAGDLEVVEESPSGVLSEAESAVAFSGVLQDSPVEVTVRVADPPVDEAAFRTGPSVESVYTEGTDHWGGDGPESSPPRREPSTEGGSKPDDRSELGSDPSRGKVDLEFGPATDVSTAPGNGAERRTNGGVTDGDVVDRIDGVWEPTVDSGSNPAIGASLGVLVGIPAYNEADSIAEVVRGAAEYADEVLVVDDGSDDGTAARAAEAGASLVEHPTNRGYGATIKTIFQEAYRRDADHLVIVDGDGQHDSDDIPELVRTQQATGAEIVIGSRFVDGAETEMPFYRRAGLSFINHLINLSFGVVRARSRVADTQCGFRAYDERAIRSLAHDVRIGDGMDASIDILFHAHQRDYRIDEVPTTVAYDVEDANSKNPLFHGYQLVKNALRTLEHERPVLLLGVPGILLLLVGVATGFMSIGTFLQTGSLTIELALPAVLFTLFGTFAAFTAIILHSVNAFTTATMGRFEADSLQPPDRQARRRRRLGGSGRQPAAPRLGPDRRADGRNEAPRR